MFSSARQEFPAWGKPPPHWVQTIWIECTRVTPDVQPGSKTRILKWILVKYSIRNVHTRSPITDWKSIIHCADPTRCEVGGSACRTYPSLSLFLVVRSKERWSSVWFLNWDGIENTLPSYTYGHQKFIPTFDKRWWTSEWTKRQKSYFYEWLLFFIPITTEQNSPWFDAPFNSTGI